MIDLATGTVDREIFTSPDVHRQELEKLFARAWLFVGHESQIAKPGDFFVSRMGDESVILCRDDRGGIHVFLNSCRHRGMKVCRYEQGNTSLFVCPVPFLELHDRRQAAGRTAVSRTLCRHAEPRGLGR